MELKEQGNGIKKQSISGELLAFFSDEEQNVIRKHFEWMTALVDGDLEPSTKAQARFVRCDRDELKPKSDFEKLWQRYKKVKKTLAERTKLRRDIAIIYKAFKAAEVSLVGDLIGWDIACDIDDRDFRWSCAEYFLTKDLGNQPDRGIRLAKAASEMGCGKASYKLGFFFEYGIHVPRSLKRAFEYYEHALRQGVDEASAKLETVKPREFTGPVQGGKAVRTKPSNSTVEDWDSSFDDNDSAYWEDYLGGPDMET